MKQRLICAILIVATCVNFSITSFAIENNDGHLIYESGEISGATIEDANDLINERNCAVLAGDYAEADKILEELYKIGVRPSTPEEIALFADPDVTSIPYSNCHHFVTSEYPRTINGVEYNIRQMSCVVDSTNCNLYHNRSIGEHRITGNLAASAFELCKMVGTSVAKDYNPIVETADTVFDVLRTIISGFSRTTIVKDVTANYSYTILEQCTFYSYQVNNVWRPFAVTSFIETEVEAVIFGLNYDGGTFSHINNARGIYKANCYANTRTYNAENQLKTYLTSYLVNYSSMISGVMLKDVNGRVLLNLGLVSPHNTSDIN